MDERFVRTALIFGEDGMRRLSDARVAVFGVGGVGGHLVQALARAGVGHITVIDDDVVSVSNINRQAVAMDSTVGRHAPGSVSFVPPVVGLIMAGEIIKTIARGNA